MRPFATALCWTTLLSATGCGLDGNWLQPTDTDSVDGDIRVCCARLPDSPVEPDEPDDEDATGENTFLRSDVTEAHKPTVFEQGEFIHSDRSLDVAILGDGFFAARDPGDVRRYFTRAGHMSRNSTGHLTFSNGMELVPRVWLPENASNVAITETGEVSYQAPYGRTESADRIRLFRFSDREAIEPAERNLFRATERSGAPVIGMPDAAGFGSVWQQKLERGMQLESQRDSD